VKIPRWIKQYKGIDIEIDVRSGKDFPDDLSSHKLIIQCGGCMVNRQFIQNRIRLASSQNVPITNYGVSIAYLHGILPRAIRPFPDALMELENIYYS
jgi:hypothetical protein